LFTGLSAHAIATTGHDLNGRFLPLYFQLTPHFVTRMWYQPIVIYAIALVLKVLPFTEGTIRLPMALAAIVDVVLLYYIAWLIFGRTFPAIAAALLLAVTPAHYINIRVAMDHYAYLPFLLGWLLCVLLYVDRQKPLILFAAGLMLGIGLYTYIAAYLLMPACVLLTAGLLYWRREPPSRYALVAAGFVIPALICVPYLLTHTVVRDTLWRYDRRELPTAGTTAIARGLLDPERFKTAASTYATFANPRFLFVDGPRSRWPIGAFLLPIAGLTVAALLRTIRRPDTTMLLLLAFVLASPVVATAVGEPGEIRRAGAMIPAVVLLAVAGLEYARMSASPVQRLVSVAIWAAVILVTVVYHDQLARGQALVRAASVPLAITGLAALVGRLPTDRAGMRNATVATAVTIVAVHAVYFVSNQSTPVGVVLLAALGLATLLQFSDDGAGQSAQAIGVIIGLATTHFLYNYVDYAQLHRVGPVPASAVILGARLMFSALAATIVLAAIAAMRGLADRVSAAMIIAIGCVLLVDVQLGYFAIDTFTDYRLRFVHVAGVLGAAGALAGLVRTAGDARLGAGRISTAGLIGIAAIQFAIFFADYFTDFRARGSGERDGNERVAYEAVLDRARTQPVAAVYLGWPSALESLYWQFYATKHHREDLLERTIPALDFNVDQIRALPQGSLVVTRPSRQVDAAINDLEAAGHVERRDLLTTPDGTRAFWILRMAAPARTF